MSTSIPSTDEEISRRDTSCCCPFNCAAICGSLYGVISTLLLPLTIRGRIGGQYGVLITKDDKEGRTELINLTDMSFAVEMFLIGLLFFVHLIGFISVLKKRIGWVLLSVIFHIGEIILCLFWIKNVLSENIKSHVMSQYSLGWYCFFALVIESISLVAVMSVSDEEVGKNKKSDEELPSTMLV
ncbi:hypothetical protein HCN44_000043 [Aphidius gifuensis]|uniref:Uncharacterized protein n=1 Tax=Aphidius gifuensis TaxID=684658 RepID=A0A834XMY1_APHGI|nr:hypothetical protein HCN44_000043 [Aphidius gifuensis]